MACLEPPQLCALIEFYKKAKSPETCFFISSFSSAGAVPLQVQEKKNTKNLLLFTIKLPRCSLLASHCSLSLCSQLLCWLATIFILNIMLISIETLVLHEDKILVILRSPIVWRVPVSSSALCRSHSSYIQANFKNPSTANGLL